MLDFWYFRLKICSKKVINQWRTRNLLFKGQSFLKSVPQYSAKNCTLERDPPVPSLHYMGSVKRYRLFWPIVPYREPFLGNQKFWPIGLYRGLVLVTYENLRQLYLIEGPFLYLMMDPLVSYNGAPIKIWALLCTFKQYSQRIISIFFLFLKFDLDEKHVTKMPLLV